MLNSPDLPHDLAACHALLAEQERTIQSHVTEVQSCKTTIETRDLTITALTDQLTKLQQENAEQKLTINELLRKAYEKRSERYLEDPNQLKIDFGNTPEAADAAAGLAEAVAESAANAVVVPEHVRRKHVPRKPRDEQLPAHLERYEVTAPIPAEVQLCPTHGEKILIGYDVLETLEFLRPKLRVRRTRFAKFACDHSPDCGVSEAPRPIGLVEGNRYDTSVAAEIITAKFGYHLPIYRQQDYFAGSGWTPARSTLLNILEAADNLLPALIEYFRREVLNSGLLGTDDTRVTLLYPHGQILPPGETAKSRRIHEVFTQSRADGKPSVPGRMWVYRSLLVPLNVFDFTVSRHRDGPDQFLIDSQFRGTLLADCYSGYQGITLRSDARILRGACNAHARRKMFDARDNHPLLSSQFLALYRQLYDVEDRARGLTADERLALRQRESQPLWDRLRETLDGPVAKDVKPKEKIAEALGYLRNQWDALSLYLTDGRLPIDNNEVEQLMKQIAIGRKNWLFLGSVAAGERAANFFTLVSSALRNDLDVYSYIQAVLDALLAGSTDYASLRPDIWAAAHPEAIRTYRQEERRDRFARQTARREQRRQTAAGTPP